MQSSFHINEAETYLEKNWRSSIPCFIGAYDLDIYLQAILSLAKKGPVIS